MGGESDPLNFLDLSLATTQLHPTQPRNDNRSTAQLQLCPLFVFEPLQTDLNYFGDRNEFEKFLTAIVTMRLTAELINNSLSYLNPLKEREMDLRGVFPLKRTDTAQLSQS